MIRSPPLEIHKPKRPKKPMPYNPKDYDSSDSSGHVEVTE